MARPSVNTPCVSDVCHNIVCHYRNVHASGGVWPPSDHSHLSSTLYQLFWLRFVSNKSRSDEFTDTRMVLFYVKIHKAALPWLISKSYFRGKTINWDAYSFWEMAASKWSEAECERKCLNRSIVVFPNHKRSWLRFLALDHGVCLPCSCVYKLAQDCLMHANGSIWF